MGNSNTFCKTKIIAKYQLKASGDSKKESTGENNAFSLVV